MTSKKGKSLVDSFVFHQAKEAVDRVTRPPEKEDPKKEKDRIRIPDTNKSIPKGAVPISLSKAQSDVYLFFDRGLNDEFNKPELQYGLAMPYMTARKAIAKFRKTIAKLESFGILTPK